MDKDVDAKKLVSDAVDAIALGYPLDGSQEEKDAWFVWLRTAIEMRAPVMREKMRQIWQEPWPDTEAE